MRVQLLSGACGSFTEVACSTSTTHNALSSDLTLGSTYYIRIHKNNTTSPSGSTWGFDICLTGTQTSRMSEVWQRTVLSNNIITTPWEVTYGPDGYFMGY